MAHVVDHLAESSGVAGHLQADVEAFLHAELVSGFLMRRVLEVQRKSDAHFGSELQPVLVEVGDDDVTRAGVAGHCGGHDADRAGTGDQDVFAENWKASAVWTALPKGSKMAADIGSMPG